MLIVCNIGHEAALEAGDPLHYTPPQVVQQIRSALWCLPLWAKSSWTQCDSWGVHPFSKHLSPYMTERELSHIATQDRVFSDISLWGYERSLALQLKKLYRLSSAQEGVEPSTALKHCWTREASVHFLNHYSSVPWREQTRMITQIRELKELLNQGVYLMKLPYSSSGRGIYRLHQIDHKTEEMVQRLLYKHHAILVEPLWDKVKDYGAEYYIDETGQVSLVGLCAFDTDTHGRYLGSLCQSPEKTKQQLLESLAEPNILDDTITQHLSYLTREIAPHYHGAVGIDLLTYRTVSGIALHPWVEINLRYTMGHYALDLYQELVPIDASTSYHLGILSAQRAKDLLVEITASPPQRSSDGRLYGGILPLSSTDLSAVSHVAYLRGDSL